MLPESPPLIVYVDVDDTLIRSVGTKRIPIPSVIRYVHSLTQKGAQLYCWSSGGAAYAREVATELGIAECFVAFLPKPHILIDDQSPEKWQTMTIIHPVECE